MVVLGAVPMPAVVALGETMVLFLAQQSGPLREAYSYTRHVAGAESNVCVGLCRLGLSAAFISRFGDDDFGRFIVMRLRGEGVDVSRCAFDGRAPTGVIVRERREVGAVEVLYYRRGSAASLLSPADLDETLIGSGQFLLLSGITPALSASCRAAVFAAAEMARAAGVTVVLDPNIRRKLWSPDEARLCLRDLLSRVDIVLPGADEASLLTGEDDPVTAARDILGLGPRLVVVKLGASGAVAVEPDGVVESPGVTIPRVVDPVGAGDAFAAGFLAGQLKGYDLGESLALANRCGAAAMLVPGDQEGLPRWDEVAGPMSSVDVRR